jgi:hypothetical protein
MLQRFLQRPESEQNQPTEQRLHTGTQFAAAFSAESPDEEIDFPEEAKNPAPARENLQKR